MKVLFDAVDKNRQLILDAERYIWLNPETGYKEFKTSKYMQEKFVQLGYDVVCAQGITGFYTQIDTGREGPKVLILGELDSIICHDHPESDKTTGAVHSCGHNAQCATLLGIAAALKEPNALGGMCGKIMLCAVPAEELLEIEYRTQLKKQGKISHFGGKVEFLSRGYFDDVDIAFMVHTTTDKEYCTALGGVGCFAKKITYKGLSAHAGSAPWEGRNALYAATCGINACNALRETFKEKDVIRFHPIITRGGEIVNAIPERVEIESYVRGSSFDAMIEANSRINQALIGSALSLNLNVEINDSAGYAPFKNDKNMIQLAEQALKEVDESLPFVIKQQISSGSTDMGDLCALMPVIHPYAPGATGIAHGSDFQIKDVEKACVTNAKWQLAMVKLLLKDGGARAKQIKKEFKPLFNSKEEYFDFCNKISRKGDRIEYQKDCAKIKL